VERDLRVLALGSFANRFGAGAVMTTSALYFTRQVGFSAAEVALAISVAAIVGIVVQVPAGHLGDTRGPRRVLTVCMVGAALASALPVLARTPWQLALLLAVLSFFERSAGSVQQGVIAQLATGGRGVLFKAYLRAVTNTAIGLGSVFGGAALVIDEPWAYVSVFVLNAVFTGFAAWNSTRLPDLPAYVRI
jgi:MFS family permease